MKTIYERFLKRTLLAIFVSHLSLLSFAATYYVSNTGSDSNKGTSSTTSWQTLAKVNSMTFAPGDQILFQKGDTFYGSLTINQSGTAGNPITFSSYGSGDQPIISGFTDVISWTNLGSNIWESTSSVSTLSTVNMVTINGVNTPMGRYPNADTNNSGYLTFQSHSGNTSITSSSLTGTPNWTGAEMVIRSGRFTLNRRIITSQSGGKINWTDNTDYELDDGYGFFIQNDSRTLDLQNEWYYSSSTKKIRIYSTSQPTNVKVASITNLFFIDNGSYINIENLAFTGANEVGIAGNLNYSVRDGNVIRNCSFTNIGIGAIGGLKCNNYLIDNNVISDVNTYAIDVSYASGIIVSNNTIQNVGIYAGMGIGINSALSTGYAPNVLIEYNKITNVGFNGINFYSNSATIKNNFIDTFCTILDDGGGIYTFSGGLPLLTGCKIEGNICINGIGANNGTDGTFPTVAAGIYLDDNSSGMEVYNNSTANTSQYGLFFNGNTNINIHNNTAYNASEYQIRFTAWGTTSYVLNDNIFVSKYPASMSMFINSGDNTIPSKITANNNYYASPIGTTDLLHIEQPSTNSGYNILTLAKWKTFSSQDANSKGSPQTIASENDLQFEYNASNSPRTVSLSRTMIDMKGAKYSGNITLQPYTSVILMKDLTSAVVPNAPTSVVATAGNASASVTFVAPTSDGGSAVTGYTVTSIPTGGIDANAGSTSLTHNITGLTNGTSYTFTVIATNSAGNSGASVASNSVIPKAPAASSFQFLGPSTGSVNSASTNFTVTPNNPFTGTITITPSGTGSAGLSAKVLTFSNSATAQTFTITPTVAGSITLTPTNNGSLTNPANLTYTVNAIIPNAPTSPVATAGNASASVTFTAPVSNGGAAITGYSVISIPAGGTDINMGSTSLNHTITGLTNGTSYTFTVKATNSVGTSVASVASNLVIPTAPVATNFTFTGSTSGNVNSTSTNFTVTPNDLFTGTITLTPSGIGSTGLSAIVLTFSNSATAQTFTIKPIVAGSITLTPTNNGKLTNPANLTYTAFAILPDAPTSVVATAGDASGSVSFVAPTSNGGSAISGYTVTSIPMGGTDINVGSTSLNHTITGLTNGISYTFTVKAINSVGSSLASTSSNPITPIAADVVIKQGEIIPSHFTTVWQGLNGLNHMNINVVSALLEDVPLSIGDEIAVFSGSRCVGAAKLIQSIVPSDNTTSLTILASQDDGTGNGFVDNDTIIFKIWDNKNQSELQVNAAVYLNDISTWKTNGKYSPGATAVVEIGSYKVYTQSIELLKGYNMISTYVSVQNPNVSVVTKTLVDQDNLIKMQDETGNSFENWGTFGGWINQLGSLEETEGYKIQVANNCTLQVTGRQISMPFDISLKTGWNIISYPRTDIVNAMNVFQTLIDQNKLVKVQDESGNSIENWGLFGGWKNGIGNLIPGKAYKVKTNTDAILTFQESYPKSAVVLANTEPTEYYHSSVEGNGTDHMNINITGLNSIGISVGDELAAFDGTVCVATAKVTEANILSGSASLASSFSTNDQNQDGFKVGDLIQILAWNKLTGDESKVNTEVISGQMKYEKNATVLVKMKSATIATVVTNLNETVKIDVFPNPCRGKVTVRFSEIPEENSLIEIFDVSGRKLISRLVSGTSEEINLDSFTPGLYLVKSILGKNEYVQKLIVNK